LLADFAPPRKGGGEAAGIRYVAKTGKVLFRLIDDIKEEYTDGDEPADLDAQVHARVILEIEDSFFSALAGDDGFGTEDDF